MRLVRWHLLTSHRFIGHLPYQPRPGQTQATKMHPQGTNSSVQTQASPRQVSIRLSQHACGLLPWSLELRIFHILCFLLQVWEVTTPHHGFPQPCKERQLHGQQRTATFTLGHCAQLILLGLLGGNGQRWQSSKHTTWDPHCSRCGNSAAGR